MLDLKIKLAAEYSLKLQCELAEMLEFVPSDSSFARVFSSCKQSLDVMASELRNLDSHLNS